MKDNQRNEAKKKVSRLEEKEKKEGGDRRT